ncbi:MAG: hypothetical protein A2902_00980 [Elusimicrobia bacterium RIFCSPLOWO2_01_FULL_64_13]|nr:MAG: hypothetical protein A2636_01305 [Elusimicrobia bacterium RIFCSPHIGHO2_01_FULL_64_10]OGR97874.1 MAG: hypothetical protein A2902_00980 [Elusimicrobia bacterium RIFCSPLOWO2_01_FULL_64_13]
MNLSPSRANSFKIRRTPRNLLAVLWSLAWGISCGGWAHAEEAAPSGVLPEVIIKGGDKRGVRSEKPPLKIEMDPNEPVLPAMEVEREPLERQPESLRSPRAGFAESLHNQNAVLPARTRLAKDPVKVFYPLREILAVSPSLFQEIGTGWEMVITDSDGKRFRRFDGRGLPPGSLPWNGRSDSGHIAEVGKTYSFVISYKDTRGQSRNFVGEPFRFDGVIHQESRGLVISLASQAVFERDKGFGEQEAVSDSGTDLLQETADWIRRNYFTLPIKVDGYAKNSQQAETRAATVARAMEKILLLPRPDIASSGAMSGLQEERIEVTIINR